jgi:hypothetical protein
MSIRKVRIGAAERAIVMPDERPVRYLGTGVHWLGYLRGRIELVRYQVESLKARVTADQAAIVPAGDLRVLRLSEQERAVVRLRGKVVGWLGPGEHCIWTVARGAAVGTDGERVDESPVRIDVLDTSAVAVEPLSAEVRAVAPASDCIELTVPHGAAGLRLVEGVIDAVLKPGRHAVCGPAASSPSSSPARTRLRRWRSPHDHIRRTGAPRRPEFSDLKVVAPS